MRRKPRALGDALLPRPPQTEISTMDKREILESHGAASLVSATEDGW